MRTDRRYIHNWNNPNKVETLPVAGIILDIKIDDWKHPYYNMSKYFEKSESQVEIATVKWFEYNIPELGESDEFNLREYNKNYTKIPLTLLSDFNKYVESLKKKVLYR